MNDDAPREAIWYENPVADFDDWLSHRPGKKRHLSKCKERKPVRRSRGTKRINTYMAGRGGGSTEAESDAADALYDAVGEWLTD